MMDDSTVQTTPEPRESNETSALDVVTTDSMTIPTSRSATVQTGDGLELTAMVPDRRLPAEYRGRIYYSTALHPDGSPCYKACPCGTGQRHEIHAGKPMQFAAGESDRWTWAANEVALFGWRRTGPSTAELRLEARVDELEEELAQEQILHDLTREEVAACEADIEALKARRVTIRGFLRRSRKATAVAEGRFGVALQAAYAGWSAALILAALLAESVIR